VKRAANVQRKTLKTFRKPGELLLQATLKDYRKVWLLRRKYKVMRRG